VLKGAISIVVQELGEQCEVLLKQGECFTVKPGQWHEFRGEEQSEVIEEMYVRYSESDIERQTIGSQV
jgi:mannose-6-phosphate isomerase-like protein (cupin superfamily)